jgi:hypothetical protein
MFFGSAAMFCRVPKILFAWAAVSLVAGLTGNGDKLLRAAEFARLSTFVPGSGDGGYFALSLSPNVAQPLVGPHDLVVLFDTSASQAGEYRDRGFQALHALLESLSPDDRVNLLAVDVNVVALTPGFVKPAGSEMQAALAQLQRRVPLGSTDMYAAMEAVVKAYARQPARARAAIYLGDGLSPTNIITPALSRQFADQFTDAQVSVISFAIGPRVDLNLMGVLAKTTGGTVVFDESPSGEQVNPRSAGRQLADAAHGWVIWPEQLTLPKGFQSVYYRGAPPLRFDRDTIILGAFTPGRMPSDGLDIRVAGKLSGKPISLQWQVSPRQSNEDQAYLVELVELSQLDGGVSLPDAGSAALDNLRRLVGVSARNFARLGRQAVATGDLNSARQLADEAARLDPTDQDALIIRQAVDRGSSRKRGSLTALKQRAPAPAAADPVLPQAADGELLDELEQQRRVTEGFLRAEVRNSLNEARSQMASDPEGASDMLKLLLTKVRMSGELNPEVRAQLADQIEAGLRAANRQSLVKGELELQRQQIEAEGEARERINRELFIQQDKVNQLMARFNALMDEERYRDAEVLADIAEEMEPGRAGLRGAELTARMVGYTADTNAVLDMRRKGFVDAAFQIELSHVPTADEPPILYPDPEVWQLLTERRKKYKAVDVTQNNPNEQKILGALDETTELDFAEQSLSDVIEYLQTRHEIPIQLDNKALTDAGVGTDTPITRNVKGITLRSALKLLLSELDLTYVLQNEVLMITSKTEAENMLTTKVYPVADLVIPVQSPMMGGRGGRF